MQPTSIPKLLAPAATLKHTGLPPRFSQACQYMQDALGFKAGLAIVHSWSNRLVNLSFLCLSYSIADMLGYQKAVAARGRCGNFPTSIGVGVAMPSASKK